MMKLSLFTLMQSVNDSELLAQYQQQGAQMIKLTTILSIALITILSLLLISLFKTYKLKSRVQFLEEKLKLQS